MTSSPAIASDAPPGIVLVGDLHGSTATLERLDQRLPRGLPILQVGDFGWYPRLVPLWEQVGAAAARSLYWIRGNHEHYPLLTGWLDATSPVEVAPNLCFLPDGVVLTLGGLRIGVLGGAASIDYKFRRLGVDWFSEENVTPAQAQRTATWEALDLMVTHVPPQHVIQESADPTALVLFRVGSAWRDPNADVVEQVWRRVDQPPLVCGHMHYAHTSADGVRVLDIGQALWFRPGDTVHTAVDLASAWPFDA